ncbi:competence protein ComEA helix-hairpin-helix repeat protein [Desulfonatronospira thiodismutans ASO3-1]|uniref:Competence protein ComEA helix-hairpin-helix repeat protein n=1 Tax=Desulfonatronospira thiodismutans ASO3-1 TaxID=555779 RepID=D6SQ76_9BACT|nr:MULTISPECIES: helix-hairpin-helix domain-containing protein [Desulfonatronospira]EFI34902.1 competence protein ComEA helix-hairpin-helix repeat protein [Desulfonatronospira thiodismutans ASO3-1]RQD74384.1 MAG: hypothetical protein D5S03_10455 [Desulfonatronospira sp. MSAO_Bac3]
MIKFSLKVVILFFALTLFLTPASSMAGDHININTADQQELESLQGIGPALSERIVEHRERFPFEEKEDIKQVSGIGESIYENIKDVIVVD